MLIFKYTAKSKSGRTLKGIVEAKSKDDAVQSLRTKELIIVALQEERAKLSLKGAFQHRKKGIKIDELVIFSRQLATMVDAGVPLANAVDILGAQMENLSFNEIVSK